ncbi:MAG: hypothetical protein Q8P68_03175 [Candidatus Peregrinibacteria bacterium]|nr:hypothetical protein [Candidatus Peregrinibacteria bacterium]MDZ4244824.1 hypothetical protein [Candidatus Gracilibacteria bacterium]
MPTNRTLSENIQNVEDIVREKYDDLELKQFEEVEAIFDEEAYDRLKQVESDLGGVVDMIVQIPFDNPSQRQAFIAQVAEAFALLSWQTDEIRQLSDNNDEQEDVLTKELMTNIDGVLGMVGFMAGSAEAVNPEAQDIQSVLMPGRDDERERPFGDFLKGCKVGAIQFVNDPSLRPRAIKILTPLYGKNVAAPMVNDGMAFITKGLDGNIYLSEKDSLTNEFRIIKGLPPVPVIDGMKVTVRRLALPAEVRTYTADFAPSSKEEHELRIDQVVDNAFTNTATIAYTQRSIEKYAKYPNFNYIVGQEIPLVRGADRRFYFADTDGNPRTDLPRAFIFSGDELSYERPIDTVEQTEGDELISGMDEQLDIMFNVKDKADQISQKYGIQIKYSHKDTALLEEYYMATTPGLKHIDVETKSQAELIADLVVIDSLLSDYGTEWIKGSHLKEILLTGAIMITDKHDMTSRTAGVDIGKGRLVVSNISSLDHEMFHVSELATVGEGEVGGSDWLVGAEQTEGGDHVHASMDMDYGKTPTEEDLEQWRKAGTTTRYGYMNGIKGGYDEVQAEMWDFIRNDAIASQTFSKKEGEGYAYTQLRKNAVRILQFAYKKSEGHMDREYWKNHGQDFDDDLWSQVEPSTTDQKEDTPMA